MTKTRILLTVIVLLGAIGMTQAEEGKLGVSLDVTYMSKYLSYGAEVYSEDGAFFETIDLDLWGTGFGAAVTHINPSNTSSMPSGTDKKDSQRLYYKLYYADKLFADEAYLTTYNLSWTYKNYYDRARNRGNIQEWVLGLSWPKLLDNGLVPKYTMVYCYPAGSGYDNNKISGFIHIFGLGYKLNVPQLPIPINLSADVTYRDGAVCTTTSPKDHDWSHATFGASTKLNLTKNLSFTPGIYQQISMEDSVNTKDDLYCKLNMKYKF